MWIAILGASSHIARNLILRFPSDVHVELFCRERRSLQVFLEQVSPAAPYRIRAYNEFFIEKYYAIINCVGVADPLKQKQDPYGVFSATEEYDNMAMKYITMYPRTRYLNFSSGAVFSSAFPEPVTDGTVACFEPNSLTGSDWYRAAKLNSEAKHRCLSTMPIVDIRIFSFFSRFIDGNAGFMLCEIARRLRDKRPFRTNSTDIVRDYISPRDLFELVWKILQYDPINCVIDARSARPVRKSELLDSLSTVFGLKIELIDMDLSTVSGKKSLYYSISEKMTQFGVEPREGSLEFILAEMPALLDRMNASPE
jgi:nucleoside-diphosphate-sugar epimerase